VIFIVVKFTVRPAHAESWMEHVGPFTTATRQEPGNLWFEWSRNVESPNQYVLLEAFRDAAAGAAHVASDHFKAAVAEQPALLAKVPDIVNVEVAGTEWSRLAEMAVPEDS
jgi:quinol monooxygenase YgiN